NVAKLETSSLAFHAWTGAEGSLRDVLLAEVYSDYHKNGRLPKLRDPSGAIGLLWSMRQLK
ncbi:hypothetical protein TeGR_g12868, partial [Tetraparma gracilis]